MQQILTIVLPVFGLIGIGVLIAWSGLLKAESGDALSDFVFVVAIPVLIFHIVATADLSGISAWRLWLAFFAAFVASWAAGTFAVRRFFGRDARGGLVAGLAAGYGNTTLIGIPLMLAAFGAAGVVPLALIIAVQLPVMMAAVTLLMLRAERQDGVREDHASASAAARAVARDLIRNPIIVGVVLGAMWRLSTLPMTGVLADLVDRLAGVASTLALIAMGMSLRKYGVRGNVGAGLALTALKLILMPALVLVLARAVGLPPGPTKVAVIAAACPTGVTPFLVATQFRTGEGLASTTITLSTAFAVASIALWLNLVEWL